MKKQCISKIVAAILPLFLTEHLNAQQTDIPRDQQDVASPQLNSSTASSRWLRLLDEQKYPESWKTASQTLKLTVPESHWVRLMNNLRTPLGTVFSRDLIRQQPAKDPKGLPKGDYMVLVYQSSFSRKNMAHELVTLIQETDGNWRVLTYQVQ